MDIVIEDVSLITTPAYNSVGFMSLVRCFQRNIWPFPVYQAMLLLVLGFFFEDCAELPYLQKVKSRIINLNAWFLPSSDLELNRVVLSLELGVILLIISVFLRRAFLRRLLSYTRWMYYSDGNHDSSLWHYIWRFGMLVGMGTNPKTFHNEAILPSLPLPSASLSINRFLESLLPHFGEHGNKFISCETNLKTFLKESGGSQRRLWAKKLLSGNHATTWWESTAYLANRESLFLNTSYFGFERNEDIPTNNQLNRAAVVLYLFGNIRTLMQAGAINPQMFMEKVPMCMAQWHRIFATTRLVSEKHDELWSFPPSYSQYFIVLSRGNFYKVPLFSVRRKIISPSHLQKQLEWLVDDSLNRSKDEKMGDLPLLTAMSRDKWNECKIEHFSKGPNKSLIDAIERSVCFVSLNEVTPTVGTDEDALVALTGFQNQVWLDKSVNFVIFKNGRLGVYVDQAAIDPAVFFTFLERLQVADNKSMYVDGNAKSIKDCDHDCDMPLYLEWNMTKAISSSLNIAQKKSVQTTKRASVATLKFTSYGRRVIKANGFSTDAFIQSLLHATFHSLTNRIPFTAELIPTRLFSQGRTDVLRPLTNEMVDFIRVFSNMQRENEGDDEVLSSLKIACQRHQFLLKHALTGKAFDRHLLSLNVATQLRTFMKCKPLDEALNIPFDIVSYRLPNAHSKAFWQLGMTDKSAFSISYMALCEPEGFAFCFTNLEKINKTDSTVFAQKLKETLDEVGKMLFL